MSKSSNLVWTFISCSEGGQSCWNDWWVSAKLGVVKYSRRCSLLRVVSTWRVHWARVSEHHTGELNGGIFLIGTSLSQPHRGTSDHISILILKSFNHWWRVYSSCNFGRTLSVGAIRFEDRFCASKKGGIGGGGQVSARSAVHVALSKLFTSMTHVWIQFYLWSARAMR